MGEGDTETREFAYTEGGENWEYGDWGADSRELQYVDGDGKGESKAGQRTVGRAGNWETESAGELAALSTNWITRRVGILVLKKL